MKKSNTVLFAFLMVAMIFFVGVNNSISQVVSDKDGNNYKTTVIGNQEWMAENLNVSHYRNGDVIPQVQDSSKWAKLTTGAWCYYENDTKKGKTYSKLYNWYAVNDPRGLAPEGWRIPTDKDWVKLTEYLGGEKVAGGKMKNLSLWDNPNMGATNESNFAAFPGGFRNNNGFFNNMGKFGVFWTSTEEDNSLAWNRALNALHSGVLRYYSNKEDGQSIRCVKDTN
jgi:uncharacterized protein (TIGR02145 family)